jgi:hypothetical protein
MADDAARAREVPPDAALRALRASHVAQARVDLARVHSSWLARAGQDESPAVARLLDGNDVAADPRIAAWTRTLAAERLVGGEPPAENDPPAVAALAGLPLRELHRLACAIGEVKLALVDDPDAAIRRGRPDGDRRPWFRERVGALLGGGDAETIRRWAAREVERTASSGSRPLRSRLELGTVTMARLLAGCEPFRVRWALQHVPYPAAKRLRALMAASPRVPEALARVEEALLQTAWERLNRERRPPLPCPEDPWRPSDVP